MSKDVVSFDWELLGARFANEDCDAQAKFFRGLAKELASCATHFEMERQFLWVMSLLNEKQKNTLREYLPCLWFDEKKDN